VSRVPRSSVSLLDERACLGAGECGVSLARRNFMRPAKTCGHLIRELYPELPCVECPAATPSQMAAQWMSDQIELHGELAQSDAAFHVQTRWPGCVRDGTDGPVFTAATLREFRALTADAVVWVRGSRYWRRREHYDPAGRRA
jgi:hypothetical protein